MPKTALGRVLLKRGLKKELTRLQEHSDDPLNVMIAVRAFREGDPNTKLIERRIDELLRACDDQLCIELRKADGKMDPDRVVEIFKHIDKRRLSPAELDQLADGGLGRTNRMKFVSDDVTALEEELAAIKSAWGQDKADAAYRSAARKSGQGAEDAAARGAFLNMRNMPPPTAHYRQVAAPLGLTEAEYMAIYTYTSADYLYINPVMANHKDKGKGEAWMRAALFPEPKKPAEPQPPTMKEGEEGYAAAKGKYDLDKSLYAGRMLSYETAMKAHAGKLKHFEEGSAQEADSRRSLIEEGALHAGMLAKALAKLPQQEKPLFRGMRLSDQQFASMAVGNVFPFENYTSMSTEESVARLFASGAKCEFEANRTVSVIVMTQLSGWDIKTLSAEATENELLVPPGDCEITSIDDDPQQFPGVPAATAWKIVKLRRKAA